MIVQMVLDIVKLLMLLLTVVSIVIVIILSIIMLIRKMIPVTVKGMLMSVKMLKRVSNFKQVQHISRNNNKAVFKTN